MSSVLDYRGYVIVALVVVLVILVFLNFFFDNVFTRFAAPPAISP